MPTRLETGPVEMPDDWPGIFIRGDQALYFAITLRQFLGDHNDESLEHVVLDGLAETLASCEFNRARGKTQLIDRRTKPVDDAAVVPTEVWDFRDDGPPAPLPGDAEPSRLLPDPLDHLTSLFDAKPIDPKEMRGPDYRQQALDLVDAAEAAMAAGGLQRAFMLAQQALRRYQLWRMFPNRAKEEGDLGPA